MEIVCVPIIVAVVYALIELYKSTMAKNKEKWLNFIPIIGLVLGVALGITFYYLVPNIITANNLFSAILVGGASGLSATGCNQIFKQLKKYGITVKENKIEETPINPPTNENEQTTPTEENKTNEE